MIFGERTLIFEHGTNNPIIARLCAQIFDLVRHSTLDSQENVKVKSIYLNDLCPLLIECWDIRHEFNQKFNEEINKQKSFSESYIIKLEQYCHNFLYSLKNFLRNLLKIFNLFYNTEYTEASEWIFEKKSNQRMSVKNWLYDQFGDTDVRSNFIRDNENWIHYFIALRNAVEHPGGHSGTLIIENFKRNSNDQILEPIWYLRDNVHFTTFKLIREDFNFALDKALIFAEEIFTQWLSNNLVAPLLKLEKIPDNLCNTENPGRFKIIFDFNKTINEL